MFGLKKRAGRTGGSRCRSIIAATSWIALITSWYAAPAFAQETSVLRFLLFKPDSRFVALGSTGAAVADDANATYWNPAGLAFQDGFGLATTRVAILPEFDAGLYLYPLSVTFAHQRFGTFAVNGRVLPWGTHECRDESSTCGRQPYDISVGASYGVSISEGLAIGATMNVLHLIRWGTEPDPITSTTYSVDVGAQYRAQPFQLLETPTFFSFGLMLANVGPTIELSDLSGELLPTHLRFGLAVRMQVDDVESLTILSDIQEPLFGLYRWDSETNMSVERHPQPFGIGAEYRVNQTLVFRAGYTTHDDQYDSAAATFGLGVNFWIARLDASWRPSLFDRAIVWGRGLTVSAVFGT